MKYTIGTILVIFLFGILVLLRVYSSGHQRADELVIDCACGDKLICSPIDLQDFSLTCTECGRNYAWGWIEPDNTALPNRLIEFEYLKQN